MRSQTGQVTPTLFCKRMLDWGPAFAGVTAVAATEQALQFFDLQAGLRGLVAVDLDC